eukprot:11218273-Alexandrium_andersonii.AAC.1
MSHAAASAGGMRARTLRSLSKGGTARRGESSRNSRCRVPCWYREGRGRPSSVRDRIMVGRGLLTAGRQP